jgi:CubicO group peptidase (beta-lactamase class C family)
MVTVLSEEILNKSLEVQFKGPDRLSGMPVVRALGWGRPDPSGAPRATGSGFGHGGAYGSIGWAEPELKLGFGYAMNRTWHPTDVRGARLLHAAIGSMT